MCDLIKSKVVEYNLQCFFITLLCLRNPNLISKIFDGTSSRYPCVPRHPSQESLRCFITLSLFIIFTSMDLDGCFVLLSENIGKERNQRCFSQVRSRKKFFISKQNLNNKQDRETILFRLKTKKKFFKFKDILSSNSCCAYQLFML